MGNEVMVEDKVLFVTGAASPGARARVGLLADSLRAFGGPLASCPIWLYDWGPPVDEYRPPEGAGITNIPIEVPPEYKGYPFGACAYVCAAAEKAAAAGIDVIVWAVPNYMFVKPPVLFYLGVDADAAFRPVHVTNVGSPLSEPPDSYWRGIYRAAGLTDVRTSVVSFVDGRELRPYFNTHAFAINPRLGILNVWARVFGDLVWDRRFQGSACEDPARRVFLFQATLSALEVAAIPDTRLRILPPSYNYPYHLHADVPTARRAATLNDLVTVAYEEDPVAPDGPLAIAEPFRSWLAARPAA